MQKARRRSFLKLRPLVNEWFQVCCTPLLGVLFTFPSQYFFSIGLPGVFSLSGWSPMIQTGFLVSRPTQVIVLAKYPCPYEGFTLFARTFQLVRVRIFRIRRRFLLPRIFLKKHGLGFIRFARHY